MPVPDGLVPELVAFSKTKHLYTGIPSSVAAVSTDAVKTSYHAVTRRAKVKSGQVVFLFGLGGLGFNALQIVLHIGARVIVSDIRPELLDQASRFGVPSEDIVPAGKSVRDFVRERGLQGRIDTTLDFVGKHQTFQDAQHIGKLLDGSSKMYPVTYWSCQFVVGANYCVLALWTRRTEST